MTTTTAVYGQAALVRDTPINGVELTRKSVSDVWVC